ncbi:YfhO family protein [Geofilum sp. OHC36d9]|uniref:YfhO family protein n=1 Tax=Geofilum sp. OHC36d9 TaxID=3458413 RepID=UPI004034BC61
MIEKLKSAGPWLAAVVLFIVLAFAYFSPVLKGRALPQMDNTHAIGMAKELIDHENATGEKAQWTDSMFGGMPAYQIRGDASANLFSYVNKVVRLGLPYNTVAIVFLYLLGFFLLLRSMGFSYWLSALGAVGFAFSSYNFIIIIAGHITKAYAIALMAPVLGGVLYTYNRNKWAGALMTILALGAEIAYNHVQITYYLAILIFILVVSRFIASVRQGTIRDFVTRSSWLVGAAVLAVLPNITGLWTTYEYGKESIRGKSELVEEETEQKAGGLDPDYAFAWSYGRWETLTLLVPNVMGGASESIGNNPELLQNTDPRLKDVVAQQSQYWGSKPFTSGPNYAGAVICFLFVLALFFYKGKEKWWLVAGTIISILLAWGHNLEWFNMFMFNHFPLYNKFRTVEMTLIIASVTIPLLALLGLREVIENPRLLRQHSRKFLAALALSGGVALFLYLFPGVFNFMSDAELDAILGQKSANPNQAALYDMLIQSLQSARMTLLKADAFRSLMFIVLASGSLWYFSGDKISAKYVIPGLLVLILVDLWGVDRRYLNNDSFKPARQVNNQFVAGKADKEILEDKDPGYRVFSIQNPFNEVRTSYFHHSIGGYHGAKLQRYQDLINRYLSDDATMLMGALQRGEKPDGLSVYLANMPVLNMLNTRYIILHPEMSPVFNPHALGSAWLVEEMQMVKSNSEEISQLKHQDLRLTAIVQEAFADVLQDVIIGAPADGDTVYLEKYSPSSLTYQAKIENSRLAVFSEIYYPKGWKAYINGQKADIFRANYVLRALILPAGESTIEFRFEPISYKYGKILSAISSLLILLFVAAYFLRRKYLK